MTDSKLLNILKKKDDKYFNRIKNLELFCIDSVYPFIELEDYTSHGLQHSINIQNLIASLIPIDLIESMNIFELFAIIASSFLHDIGMVKKIQPDESSDSIRVNHAERSKNIIEADYNRLFLSRYEAQIIGVICEAHCKKNVEYIDESLYSLPDCDSPRIKFLATLLRLGDILDISYNRVSELVFKHRELNSTSKKHWINHLNVSNVKIVNIPSWDIIIHAVADEDDEIKELQLIHTYIKKELEISRNILRSNDLYYKEVGLNIVRKSKTYTRKFNNPFMLLQSFTNKDILRFAGRERQIFQIVQMVTRRNLVLIIGESGVGKTSLLNAGILPALRKEYSYEIIEFSFSKEPVKQIIDSLSEKNEKLKTTTSGSIYRAIQIINKEKNKNKDKECKYLFVGDHLEQLFTLDTEYREFIKQLSELLNEKIATFLFCIREDYLPQLFDFSNYIEDFYNKSNTYRLFKFDKNDAMLIFQKASEVSKVQLPDDFIQTIVDDLYAECEGSIYPPYLQIVGHEIYQAILQSFNIKGLDYNEIESISDFFNSPRLHNIYEKLGGTRKIIIGYLSSLLDKYQYQEKKYVAQILKSLITQYYTKKRVSYDYLKSNLSHIIDIDKLLNSLIKERIIKKSLDEYELTHDFLAQKILTLIKNDEHLSKHTRKVFDVIEQRYVNPDLTVKDIAEEMGITQNHLSTLFGKETQKGINEYINEYRINKAKILLDNTKDEIKDIAKQTGFKSQNSFSRKFKEIVNKTPKEYRDEKK